ncbi:glycosyltransferase family 2 protein [Flagellimonas zhangzhouensis]|uniref:Glycosyl transferase family 2 n=1 Tax=Flagellimonas zhangzhouensis TaxID=1073328 RepID=A0A1H2YRV3_9FLAO|nr:glycosyltransferase family 2 protein [Allomuricauda zhangzhouensis]SDR00471.1 Glycosyl transferase family 2 [Allomuricauda zhangzhouensis]SDX07364.1 Glycosyl transferase family 2 [Allomuricauda zhangzhouensis]
MNQLDTVEISVIVPIFRIEKYLPKCIESLLDQSFTNFELILVDDGSPDNCPKICDDYAKKDARIKVIHKENGGLLSARKAGLKNASGKYISYVDGDDWVDKFYLDILYKLVEANSSDLVVTGHFREFDGKIETIKPKTAGNFSLEQLQSSILPTAIFNGRFCEHGISTYVWNKLFKKSLLSKVLYDVPNEIIMGEDAAITYAYLAISKKVTVSRIPTYYYRQRHDSIVKSIENPQMEYYRLGLLMSFLKSKLSNVLDSDNLNKQLTYYLYSQILVRSGGVILDTNGELIFNPFVNVKRNAKVVVYSSGSFGQHMLSTNTKTDFFQIVKWIDLDYHPMNVGGNYVQPISAVNNDEFDYLVIATINPTNYDAIKKELGLMGIDKNKIVEINTDITSINPFLKTLGFDAQFEFQKN